VRLPAPAIVVVIFEAASRIASSPPATSAWHPPGSNSAWCFAKRISP
jgi:hypothetical protein